MATRFTLNELVFKAIADGTRRDILDGLAAGPRRATDIAADYDAARPTIVKHLRMLEQAGLVRVKASGRERRYYLQSAGLKRVDAWLATYRTVWEARRVLRERS
ncbi:MAG: metalloregulator ArsR/SmtB family transcription factor [Planctomycetota bacterium]